MSLPSISLAELAQQLDCDLQGDGECQISGVATLADAKTGQISFLANSHYRRYLSETSASAVILKVDDLTDCPVNALVAHNPYLVFARAATLLNPGRNYVPGIDVSAVVDDDALVDISVHIAAGVVVEAGVVIGPNSVIGPACVVKQDVKIGADCRLSANVCLCEDVKLGDRVLIHPGAVIGSDGFGFAHDSVQGGWVKVPQLGAVVIGDDVEIGANTTIDRGALGDTVIEEGVIMDNQIQIAHNVHIGAQSAIAGCVGIAGSTRIGKRCQIGGGVGIVGHLTIVDDVHITATSLVTGNINRPGLYSSGTALSENRQWRKNAARFSRLDDMAKRLKALEKKLEK